MRLEVFPVTRCHDYAGSSSAVELQVAKSGLKARAHGRPNSRQIPLQGRSGRPMKLERCTESRVISNGTVIYGRKSETEVPASGGGLPVTRRLAFDERATAVTWRGLTSTSECV